MTTTRKRSKQRDCIQQFLELRTDHPTAEMVYQNIREDMPHISLATVYRNLSLLAEMGEIQKFSTGDGPDRFDPITSPHDHFICRECGCLMDMKTGQAPRLIKDAGREFPGKIDNCRVFYYGKCPDCLEKEQPA